MKLYTVNRAISKTYISEVDAKYKDGEIYFGEASYKENGDYSDVINQLDFFLKRNEDGERFIEYQYKALDFFSTSFFVKRKDRSIILDFYVVSPKTKGILEQLQLPKHHFYKIALDIDGKQEKKEHYLFQIEFNKDEYLDFANTVFYGSKFIEVEGSEEEEQINIYKKGEIGSKGTIDYMQEEHEIDCYIKTFGVTKTLDWLFLKPEHLISEKAYALFQENQLTGIENINMYKKESNLLQGNDLGYNNAYGGFEVVMDGESSMDGLNVNDFPKAEKDDYDFFSI